MEAIRRKIPMMSRDGKLQMISGDGKFSSETASFVKDMENYTVISIIGPQSSGKSYLLNKLFKTKFDVLNAAKGRKQTTKGIWIAKCTNPNMIIMDVEGCDGKERAEGETKFEKQTALFALVVSDFLLLNIWFNDIGRSNAANAELIELIFQGRLKIEATKTTIIIVVRDYDSETPVEVIKEQLVWDMKTIWENKVHPPQDKTMDDYFQFIVWDFPSNKRGFEREFEQKCKSSSDYFSDFAAKQNLEQTEYTSTTFANSSKNIWDHICCDKKIIAADQKVAKSKYTCEKIIRKELDSFDQEKVNWMIDLSIPVKEFAQEFFLFQKKILTRYDVGTTSVITSVRDKKRTKLEMQLLPRFQKGFHARMRHLASKILSSARSEIHPELEKLFKLDNSAMDNSAIEDAIKPYLKEFDDNTPDLQRFRYQDTELPNIRTKFVTNLTKHAEEVATIIQDVRSEFKCRKIKKEILDSFEQEKAFWMNDFFNIPAKKFTEEFSVLRKEILTRYEKQTASFNSDRRNAEKADLEMRLLSRFSEGLYDRMNYMVREIQFLARSNLTSELKKLKELNESAVTEVLHSYLKRFIDQTPTAADLKWYPNDDCLVELQKIRVKFATDLIHFAEHKANKIKKKRAIWKGLGAITQIIIGTAWASATWDSSVLTSGVIALASINQGINLALLD